MSRSCSAALALVGVAASLAMGRAAAIRLRQGGDGAGDRGLGHRRARRRHRACRRAAAPSPKARRSTTKSARAATARSANRTATCRSRAAWARSRRTSRCARPAASSTTRPRCGTTSTARCRSTRRRRCTPDEVYALTAYVLNLNDILPNDAVVDQDSLPKLRMPNRDGFTTRHGFMSRDGKPDTHNTACMKDCVREVRLSSEMPDYARDQHGNLAEQVRGGPPPAATRAAKSGLDLAKAAACTACHGVSERVVGPGLSGDGERSTRATLAPRTGLPPRSGREAGACGVRSRCRRSRRSRTRTLGRSCSGSSAGAK